MDEGDRGLPEREYERFVRDHRSVSEEKLSFERVTDCKSGPTIQKSTWHDDNVPTARSHHQEADGPPQESSYRNYPHSLRSHFMKAKIGYFRRIEI